jgi:hypothetical protein
MSRVALAVFVACTALTVCYAGVNLDAAKMAKTLAAELRHPDPVRRSRASDAVTKTRAKLARRRAKERESSATTENQVPKTTFFHRIENYEHHCKFKSDTNNQRSKRECSGIPGCAWTAGNGGGYCSKLKMSTESECNSRDGTRQVQ